MLDRLGTCFKPVAKKPHAETRQSTAPEGHGAEAEPLKHARRSGGLVSDRVSS